MARTCSIAELRQEFEVLHVGEDAIVRAPARRSPFGLSHTPAAQFPWIPPGQCHTTPEPPIHPGEMCGWPGFLGSGAVHRSSSWFGGHRHPLDANCWCGRLARVPRTVLALPQIWVSARCISGLGPASIERQVTGMAGDRRLLEEFR
jgi:hypothetical protein